MSELFPITILPEGGLSSSVTTTVLLGVWVVAFFNLRFGWTLSALVVPGYVVPLLLVKPITVGVIVMESVLTYCAARLISERVRFRGCWASFFGRDRFFLILFLSVCIKLLFDALVLPRVALIYPAWEIDLHSFGLVVVPLIANYLWKPGAARGLFHLNVMVTLTLFLTRYVLIPYTNFRMSGLYYMYEDAGGLLSSPKSYIVLLSTAYIASRVNLRYGWEYSGILIPALLALEWDTPVKVIASLVESAVILIGARLILATPLLRGMTMEGARKIVLFFTVGYVWRMLLGFYLHAWLPDLQAPDVYGFGYLLSTLIAIKANDRGAAIRIAGATLRLCGVGAGIGCAVGFTLTLAPEPPELFSKASAPPPTSLGHVQLADNLASQIRLDKLRLYAAARPGNFQPMSETELNAFDAGFRALLHSQPAADSESFERGARWMNLAGMEAAIVDSRYCLIRDQEPFRGRGLYVLDLKSNSDLAIAVPQPLGQPESLDVALSIFQQQEARALLVNSDQPARIADSSRRSAHVSLSSFSRSAHLVSGGNLLVVAGQDSASPATDCLSIKRSLPKGLNTKQLRGMFPNMEIHWGLPAMADSWLDEFWSGVAVLNTTSESRLTAAAAAFRDGRQSNCGLSLIQEPLGRWLLDQKDRIALEDSEAYHQATLDEMFYLDVEVVTPLIQIASRVDSLNEVDPSSSNRLQLAALAAEAVDLQLAAIVDESTGSEYLILRDSPGVNNRHWGTIVFRLGASFPAVFEVSRPIAELWTLEFGTAIYEASDGFAFQLSGAHLRANGDGSADMLQLANKVSLLHLVRQVLLRIPQERLFVQIRAIQTSFSKDAVLSTGTLVQSESELPPLTKQLRECLKSRLGVDSLLNGTDAEAAGYPVSGLYARLMQSQPASREVASLWLSSSLRRRYRPVAESTLMGDQMRALDIPMTTASLDDYLTSETPADSAFPAESFPRETTRNELKALILDYISREDILLLRKLQHEYADWHWLKLDDLETGQPFLILTSPNRSYRLVVNLAPGMFNTVPILRDKPTRDNLREFLRRRQRMIEFGRQR